MAAIETVERVVQICAVISRYADVRDAAVAMLGKQWGPILLRTDPMPFEAGGYYSSEMGNGLLKVLVAIEEVADPGLLAGWKTQTNRLEKEFAANCEHPETRPLNLDPGYLTQAKLVLATTKDRDHRVYLSDGIFGEVTLTYVGKRWTHHRWTYPTYRSAEVAQFVHACRLHLRTHLQATRQFRTRI